MPLTRIDSAFLDLDAIGGIDFDVQSGVPTFTVDATTHRVGIGTATPARKLQIHENSSSGSFLSFTNTTTGVSGADGALIGIQDDESLIVSNKENNHIEFHTNNTEKLRIESTGGVKFTAQGTSIPIGGILHHTNNNLYIRGGTAGLILSNQDNTNIIQISESDFIRFETSDGTEKLRITSDGYLKLSGRNVQGTANGDKLLRIYQPSRTDSEEDVILLQSYNTSTENDLKIGGGDSTFNAVTSITFRTAGINTTSGSDRLCITSDGNVGIGTASPSHLLHVNGLSRFEDFIRGHSTHNKLYIADDIALTATKKLYLDGGSNSYIHEPSADNIAVVIGTERLRIDSSGSIGIGTTTPATDFHIHSSSGSSNTEILLTNGDTGAAATDGFKIALNTGEGGEIWNYENDYIRFGTNNTERLRIDSTGNVGVGTASPSKILHLYGTNPFMLIQADSITGNSGFNFSDGANKGQILYDHNGDYMRFSTGGSSNERLRIDGSGRVQIGMTDGASTRLHVANGDAQQAGVQKDCARFIASTAVPANTGGLTIGAVWHNTDVTRRIAYLQSEQGLDAGGTGRALGLNPNGGNVGIGTDNPASRFEVRSGGTNAISGTLFSGGFTQTITAGEPQIAFVSNIDGTGNPSASEAARGGIGFSWANAADRTRFIVGTNSNLPVRIYTNNSEKVRVNADGNVGIGTDDPSKKLTVYGESYFYHSSGNSATYDFVGNHYSQIQITGDADASAGGPYYNSVVTNGSDGTLEFRNNTTANLKVTYNGVVQIGGDVGDAANDIDTSNTKLTIKQSGMGLEDGIYLERPNERRGHYIRVATSGSAQDALVFGTNQFGTETDHLLALDRGGNVTMMAGNVGIGTDDPGSFKLSVRNGGLHVTGNSNDDYDYIGGIQVGNGVAAPTLATFDNNQTTNYRRLTLASIHAGDVHLRSFWGISVDINDGQLNDSTSATQARIPSTSSFTVNRRSGNGAFSTLLAVRNSGNVGISTDNPTAKLQVQGTSYITSKLSVGISQFTDNAGLTVSASGAKFFNDSLWMQPAGNVLFSARGGSGDDNWIGIGGFYNVTGGSSNILLQANFSNTSSGSGHAIRSIATGTGTQDFKIQRVYAAASTSGRPTYTDVLTINNDNGVSIVNQGGTITTLAANGITQMSQERTFEFGISESSNHPTCNVGASQYAIGSFSGNSGYYYMVIEAWCHHRGYTNGGYSEYKKWIVLVGDKISSNLVCGSGNDNHLGLWDGSSGSNNGFNNFSTSGATMYLMVNPSCGARRTGRCRVRFYTSMPFTPDGSRISSNTTVRSNQQSPFRGNGGSKPYIGNYSTTSNSANVHVSSGQLFEVTSSLRYKTNVEDLQSSYADNVIDNLRPVWYRSKQENTDDPANHSYFGLIAEEVAEIEPRLVNYTQFDEDYEDVPIGTYTDEDGEEQVTVERRLKADAELRPQSVQYDRLSVMLLDVIQRQKAELAALTARVAALEAGN